MILVWTLLIAAAVGNVHGGVVNIAERNATSRIVGGAFTTIDRYPSLVQVEFRYNFLFWYQVCAGVILTPRYTLSVAQCFTGFLFSINQRRIRAGSSFRNLGGVIGEINKAYNHPYYGRNGYDSDLTVLQLNQPLTFTHTISPAMIPAQGFELFDNLPVTHIGWGKTRIGGGGSAAEQLQEVQLFTINHELCTARYASLSRSPRVTTNMVCSGILNSSSKDTCDGDEGGPMMFNGDIVAGITSWRRGCADSTYPSVNTKVSAFTNWINEAIAV